MILFQPFLFSFLQLLRLLLPFIFFYCLIISIFFRDYLLTYQFLNFINEYAFLKMFSHFIKTKPDLLNLKFVFFNIQLCHINLKDLQLIIYFLTHLLYFHMLFFQHKILYLLLIFKIFIKFLNVVSIHKVHFIFIFQIAKSTPSNSPLLDIFIHCLLIINLFFSRTLKSIIIFQPHVNP